MSAIADPEVQEPPTLEGRGSHAKRALFAAQQHFPDLVKDKENSHFKQRYASLDAIKTACWPHLHAAGLLPYWETDQRDGKLFVAFVLEHVESGDRLVNTLSTADGATMHALGSEITYLRRYTASPLLGITPDEDDDGNSATHSAANRGEAKRPASKPAPEPAKQLTTAEKIGQQKTAADLGSLLMAWVGKRPVAKHSKEWARIVSEAANHISGAGWPEDQVRPVLAVLNGLRKEILDLDSKEAFGGDTPEPAKETPPAETPAPKTGDAAKAPSLERIAGWLDQLETAPELQNALVSIDASPKFADLRADAARVIEVLRHAQSLVAGRVQLKEWTDESAAALAEQLGDLETKYDLSQQAAAQFTGSDA